MRRIFLLFALAVLLAASLPARAGQDCRPGESLDACAARLWRAESAAWRDLLQAPARGMERYAMRRLTAAPWELVLARDVAAVAPDPAGLAVACADGRILAWTAAGLCLARMPGKATPARLAWAGGRHLAVLDASGRQVFVLNLGTGQFANGAHDLGEAVSALALERSGLLLAADAVGRVWAGPVLGPLAPVVSTKQPAVALGLGRDLGVMAAADAAGQVTLTALRPLREIDHIRMAGGPFVSGRVQDNVLVMRTAEGADLGLDLATRRPVAAPPASRPMDVGLAVVDRTLVFRPGPDSPLARTWSLETVVERRFPSVWRSPLGRALRVEDFDGQARTYRLGTGLPFAPEPTEDWQRVSLDPLGRFTAEGAAYALGDVVYADAGQALLARQVGEGTWYFWWAPGGMVAETRPRPGLLPARSTLRADVPPDWIRMEPTP